MSEAFPAYLPADARRLFASEGVVRRIAHVAKWSPQAEVLELFGSDAGVALAAAVSCRVTLVDTDAAAVDLLKGKAKAANLGDRLAVKHADWADLGVKDGSLDGLIALGRFVGPPAETAAKLRPLLASRGRLAITWPVKVGFKQVKATAEYWEKRTGAPLLLPRECLMAVEKQGFEPELIETVTEQDLDEYYRQLEAAVAKLPAADKGKAKELQAEITAHRDGGGRSGVSIALVVARRKEPGERPPASRDGG